MKKLIGLGLALVSIMSSCAPMYGDPPSAPSEERASSSGGEASAAPSNPIEAGQRIAELRQQIRVNEETHQRLTAIARRATDEANRLRQQASAATTQPPTPTTPTPQPPTAPPMTGIPGPGMGGMGLANAPGQNPSIPVMVPPYGVVNNMAWVGRPAPSQMLGGDVPTINLYITGVARYATVIWTREGRLICPSIATAIMTVGRQQLCAIPANPLGWSATVEMFSPGRHEFVVRRYRMHSYTGMGSLVSEHLVAGDTETYPNVELPPGGS